MWIGLGLARGLGIKRAALLDRLIFLPLWLLSATVAFNAWGISAGAWEAQPFLNAFLDNPVYGRESWLWLLAHALLLEPQAILLTTLLSIGLAALSYRFLPAMLIPVMQQSQVQQRRSSKYIQKQFVSGIVRNIILKEWRILLRSPNLWSSSLTLISLLEILMLGVYYLYASFPLIDVWALLTLFGAGMYTIVLVRSCLLQDQGAGWLGAIPIHSLKLRCSKLLAILMFLWCAFIPVGVVIKLLNGPGLLLIGLLIPVTITQAVLALWNACPLDQAPKDLAELSFMGRDSTLAVFEFVALMNWISLAVYVYAQHWLFCFLVACLSVAVMLLSYRRSRKLGASLIPY